MLNLKRNGLSYRDWFVQAVPRGPVFCFCCYHNSLGSHTTGTAYPTQEAAILAGCQFIDRELAVVALGQIVDEWMRADKITLEEYWNLNNFCSNPEVG